MFMPSPPLAGSLDKSLSEGISSPGTPNADPDCRLGLPADVCVVEHTVRTLKSDEAQQTVVLPPTDSKSAKYIIYMYF